MREGNFTSSIVNYIVKKSIGLDISYDSAEIVNLENITLRNVLIRDDKGRELAYVNYANLGLDIFGKKKLKYLKLKKAEIFLELDLPNDFINWRYPFRDIDDLEYLPFSIPDLGDIEITNSKIFFIDREVNVSKELNKLNGKLTFNSKDNVINIAASAEKGNEKYSCKVNISEKGADTSLVCKNIQLDEDALKYSRAKDHFSFDRGVGDLDIKIVDGDIYGQISAENVELSTKYINKKFTKVKSILQFNKNILTGVIEGIIDKELTTIELTMDFANEILDMKMENSNFKIDNLQNIPLVKDLVKGVGSVTFSSKFDFNNNNVIMDINFNSDKIDILNIPFREGKIKLNCQLSQKDIIPLRIDVDLRRENGFVALSIDKGLWNYHSKFEANLNTKYLSQYLNITLPINNFNVKGTFSSNKLFTKITSNFLLEFDNIIVGDKDITIDLKYYKKIFKINGKNRGMNFNIDITDSFNRIDAKFKDDFYFNSDIIKCRGSGYLRFIQKKDGNIFNVDGSNISFKFKEIDIWGIDIDPILFECKVNKNKIFFLPFNMRGHNDVLSFDSGLITMTSIINPLSNSLSTYLKTNFIDIKSSLINERYSDVVSSTYIDSTIFELKKLSSDKFIFNGKYLLLTKEKNFNLFLDSMKIDIKESLMKDINMTISGKEDFNINIKSGSLNINNYEMPIQGYAVYRDSKILIKDLLLGENHLKGKIFNSGEIDLMYSIYGDKTLRNFINYPIKLFGEIMIYGNISSPLMYGNIFVNDLFNKLIFNSKFSYDNKILSFNYFKILNEDIEIEVPLNGYINLERDVIKINASHDNIDLSNIIDNLHGNAAIAIDVQGSFEKIFYSLSVESIDNEYFGMKAHNISIHATGDNYRVDVDKFRIQNLESEVNAAGYYDFDTLKYLMYAKSKSIDLATFIPFKSYVNKLNGVAEFDILINNSNVDGFFKVNNLFCSLNVNRYYKFNSNIELSKCYLSSTIEGNTLSLDIKGKINDGSIKWSSKADVLDFNNSLTSSIICNKVSLFVDSYLSSIINLNISLDKKMLSGDIDILSGKLLDIPNFSGDDSLNDKQNEDKYFIIDNIFINVNKNFSLSLNNLLNLEKINAHLEGNLKISENDGNIGIEGNILSNRGFIEFSKYKFGLDNFKLTFEKNKSKPDIFLLASSSILNHNIFLGLSGNLGDQNIRITKLTDEISEENSLKISLWSNTGLNLNDILYLLSHGSVSQRDNEGVIGLESTQFISQQLSKSLILNPISKKIKDFFGLYSFKINSPILSFKNIAKDRVNLLEGTEIELATNIFKNKLFMGTKLIIGETKEQYLKSAELDLFTLNEWSIGVVLDKPFSSEISIKDIVISKGINFKKVDLEIGVMGIDKIINIDKLSNVGFKLSFDTRF